MHVFFLFYSNLVIGKFILRLNIIKQNASESVKSLTTFFEDNIVD